MAKSMEPFPLASQTQGSHFSGAIGESSKIVPVLSENLGLGCLA